MPDALAAASACAGFSTAVVAARGLNENVGTPDIADGVAEKRRAVARRNERQHAAAGVGFVGHLGGQMRRDALDIFHERHRIFEDIVIDALKNVADAGATLIKATQQVLLIWPLP